MYMLGAALERRQRAAPAFHPCGFNFLVSRADACATDEASNVRFGGSNVVLAYRRSGSRHERLREDDGTRKIQALRVL